jgi:hypothetical protein
MAVSKIEGDANNLLSPGWQLIATATASASATIDFDSGIDFTAYDQYIVMGNNIVPATDDSELIMQFDYGSGYIATGYVANLMLSDNGGARNSLSSSGTGIHLAGTGSVGWGLGNAANESSCFQTTILNANDSYYQSAVTVCMASNSGSRGGSGAGTAE